MTSLILSFTMLTLTPQGTKGGTTTDAGGGNPPPSASIPWAVAPEPVGGSISGPDTVTIPGGSSQSLLFGINLTRTDTDTFREYPNNVASDVARGTALAVHVNEDPNNGKAIPGGGNGAEVIVFVNTTTSSSSASSITDAHNYRALRLQDTAYPAERVISYELYDATPAGPVPGDPQTWIIHDTNRPVFSKNVTVVLGS